VTTNVGDIVVCGILEDVLVEDIRIMCPKGHATTITADLVVRSTDLHRALSQGRLFQLNTNSLLRLKFPKTPGGAAEEERFAADIAKAVAAKSQQEQDRLTGVMGSLQVENDKLRVDNVQLRAENTRLLADNARLQAELDTAKLTDGKLDQMLSMLKDRPTVVQTVVQGQAAAARVTQAEDDVPKFIPSQIKPESVDVSRIAVQEQSGEVGGVASASDALKKLRRQSGQ